MQEGMSVSSLIWGQAGGFAAWCLSLCGMVCASRGALPCLSSGFTVLQGWITGVQVLGTPALLPAMTKSSAVLVPLRLCFFFLFSLPFLSLLGSRVGGWMPALAVLCGLGSLVTPLAAQALAQHELAFPSVPGAVPRPFTARILPLLLSGSQAMSFLNCGIK